MAERQIGESIGRIFDEPAARERQRTNKAVAEEIVKHRRASARRMIADLLFRLEDEHTAMLGKRGCRGKSGDAAADDEDVGVRHAVVSRSLTTLPPCVRRIALTMSSSSGSTGRPCSLSQKADRKL